MATITQDTIRRLAAFDSHGVPVTSCYLDVDGRRYVRRQDYEAELDRMVRAVRASKNGTASIADDLRRIEAFVRAGIDRSRTRGVAVFSCAESELWEPVMLPVPVVNRISIGTAPAVGQLEAIVQELVRIGVLLVDRMRVRVFVFELGELVERTELNDELPRDYDERGKLERGEPAHHIEELASQHLRHAARVAFELFQESRFDHLVVGAPSELLGTIEHELHPYLRERLSDRIDVPVAAPIEQIRAAVLDAEARIELQVEDQLVERLRAAIAKGTGVAGLQSVLDALVERRVEHLLVSRGFTDGGWRCDVCKQLTTVGRSCPLCGEPMSVLDDVVEEAIDAALSQACQVTLCNGNADLDVLGRVGALLRY